MPDDHAEWSPLDYSLNIIFHLRRIGRSSYPYSFKGQPFKPSYAEEITQPYAADYPDLPEDQDDVPLKDHGVKPRP